MILLQSNFERCKLAHVHIKLNIRQHSRLQGAIQVPLYQVCQRLQAIFAQPACDTNLCTRFAFHAY